MEIGLSKIGNDQAPAKDKRPVLVLLVASLFWGMSWWPLKSLHQMGFDGPFIIFVAYGLLSLLFLPILWHFKSTLKNNIKPWLLIVVLGGGANLAFNYSLIYGDVIRVMVLFYLLPLWGVLGGKFILKERVPMLGWLAAGLAISGAFLVVGGVEIFESPPTWIDFLALLSGFLFAMNNIAFRGVQSLPVVVKLSALFMGTMLMSGILVLNQDVHLAGNISISAWLWLAAFGLVWLLISNLGSQWAVTHMPASQSSIIMIMELVAAVISAMLFNGETLNLIEGLGAALILSAALIEALRSHKDSNT
ncbi:DMT family transporter [Thiomicrorhabdus sp.]|uniref:DMT family transporter n=1 Tax=Thiomicrorhabdus sp. TaxID=2039724 RepID=UPI002AA8B0F5|nr:DMT family transporter [Thiomicrorhabdus sp.]